MNEESIVYAGMTAAEVEKNYNLRRAVPDHEAIFARNAKDSARVREHADRKWLDVRFGSGDRQLLNLYLPHGDGPFPALIFIHGGYWRAFSRESYDFLAPAFLDAGVAFVNVDYDLCPTISLEGLINQVREAMVWVQHHAGSYGIDASRVAVSGHSAGGHLTAMMLATDWSGYGLKRPPMRGGLAISGVFDLHPILYTAFNEDVRLTDDAVESLSPINLPPRAPIPLVCAVGADETADFRRQQSEFAAVWRKAGAPVEKMVIPGRHHFDVIDALSEPDHAMHQAALGLLGIKR